MGVVVFFLVAGAVAAPIVFLAARGRRYKGSEAWPVVEGVIAEGVPEVRSSRSTYFGIVTYVYSVAGERYAGRWNTPWRRTDREVIEMVATYLRSGTAVQVRYDPRDAGTSLMIDPGIPGEYDPIELRL